ncbi:hypothetical protein ZIOFF_021555 [Zingiber officinale]|uniref:Uncharacterized protein n=1 Tax=Zingiber officinale TaxID=94328 RepID=A0A8J5H412_ZINOF|nr:hypothetical protein ZIOFF_021555 [Zingiber officinale]
MSSAKVRLRPSVASTSLGSRTTTSRQRNKRSEPERRYRQQWGYGSEWPEKADVSSAPPLVAYPIKPMGGARGDDIQARAETGKSTMDSMEVAQCFVSLAFAVCSHRSRVALISRASFELGSTERSVRTSGSLLEEKGRVSATRRGRRSACLGMDRLNCKSKVAPGNRSFSRKNRDREDILRSCAALAAL